MKRATLEPGGQRNLSRIAIRQGVLMRESPNDQTSGRDASDQVPLWRAAGSVRLLVIGSNVRTSHRRHLHDSAGLAALAAAARCDPGRLGWFDALGRYCELLTYASCYGGRPLVHL